METGRSGETGGDLERVEAQCEAAVLFRALGRAQGLDQLERTILAYAVHPFGLGCARAHLLWWDAAGARLLFRASATTPRAGSRLAGALDQARLATSSDPSPWSGQRIDPARLEGAPASAWQRLASATGPGAGEPAPWVHGAVIGALALRRAGIPFALLVGEWSTADGCPAEPALERTREIIEAGIEACDRALDAARRARAAAAISEMARASVAPANLAEILHVAVRLASTASGAAGGALWLARERAPEARGSRTPPRLEVTFGAPGERERLARALQPIAAAAIKTGRPRASEKPTRELDLSPESAAALSAFAVIPLAAWGRVLGAIGIYDPCRAHPAEGAGFGPEEIELVQTLANVAALALVEAGRTGELESAERRNLELRTRVARQERLCALGEEATGMARAAKNPLASIRAFARRLGGSLADDPRMEYVEVILAEAERLEQVMGSSLEEAVVDPAAMKIESLNAVVQQALELAGPRLVRRRIRLVKKLSPEMPELLLDSVRVRRAFTNVLDHALEAVSVGGRVRIETRRVAHHVVIETAHDAHQEPGGVLEQVFVPFSSGPAGAPGVGLEVARQIVRDHGGEVRVRSEGEWGLIVTLTLPVTGNQDRRRAPNDRRRTRDDRRERFPHS